LKPYLELPPSISWPFSNGLGFAATGYFDGHRRQELLLAGTPVGIASLAVAFYFRYDDLANDWASASYGSPAITSTSVGSVSPSAPGTDP